jgi:hypothetical protein
MQMDTWQVHRFIPSSVDFFISKQKASKKFSRLSHRAILSLYDLHRGAVTPAGATCGGLGRKIEDRAAPKTPPKPRVVTTSASKVVALPRRGEAPRPAVAGAQENWSEF